MKSRFNSSLSTSFIRLTTTISRLLYLCTVQQHNAINISTFSVRMRASNFYFSRRPQGIQERFKRQTHSTSLDSTPHIQHIHILQPVHIFSIRQIYLNLSLLMEKINICTPKQNQQIISLFEKNNWSNEVRWIQRKNQTLNASKNIISTKY